MKLVEIPLRPIDQTFRVSLSGRTYVFRLMWNSALRAWVLDIADANSAPILSGVPLITGTDLLAPVPYLEFGGELYVQSDGNATAVPDRLTLGTEGHLYYVTAS